MIKSILTALLLTASASAYTFPEPLVGLKPNQEQCETLPDGATICVINPSGCERLDDGTIVCAGKTEETP
jgi:hypothetical protein